MPANQIAIGKGNEGQIQAWDGDEGEQWAARPEFYDRAVRHHQDRLMLTARIGSTDRVLDIGCGNGESTRAAARAADGGLAVGVDLSAQMLERAHERAEAEGLGNVSFVQADAQIHPFEPEAFDVALSRFGAMFFGDQVAAFTNIRRALAPGGRLVLASWRGPDRGRVDLSLADALTLGKGLQAPPPDAPSPFAHADETRTTRILHNAGFEDAAFESVDVPMYFGDDADEAYAVLGESLAWMMGDLQGQDRSTALENLRGALRAHQTPDGVAYGSSAWIITARRA